MCGPRYASRKTRTLRTASLTAGGCGVAELPADGGRGARRLCAPTSCGVSCTQEGGWGSWRGRGRLHRSQPLDSRQNSRFECWVWSVATGECEGVLEGQHDAEKDGPADDSYSCSSIAFFCGSRPASSCQDWSIKVRTLNAFRCGLPSARYAGRRLAGRKSVDGVKGPVGDHGARPPPPARPPPNGP